MAVGKVKWFSDALGYGFIQIRDDSAPGKDVFVHYSEIVDKGYRTLVPGQDVRFEMENGPRGLQARKVEIVIELS